MTSRTRPGGAAHLAAPVLFIGGWGRSGSTLVECLLAELDGVVVLGEVVHLWERGVRLNQLCACGTPFHDCPFWTQVGSLAFGGWDRVDLDRLFRLKNAVDRQRRLFRTARRRPGQAWTLLLEEYTDHYRRIYDAAASLTGARAVVDSSKEVSTATALTHNPEIDLRVLHVIRDSRGVAYSWSKVVERPETQTGQPMPQYSPTRSTVYWLSGNVAIRGVAHRGTPLWRMRYEDLVRDPGQQIREAWNGLAMPGPAELPMVDGRTVSLHPTHSVAGNPMRFRTGLTTITPDAEWQTAMRPADRRLVTTLSYPALKAFGYLERNS